MDLGWDEVGEAAVDLDRDSSHQDRTGVVWEASSKDSNNLAMVVHQLMDLVSRSREDMLIKGMAMVSRQVVTSSSSGIREVKVHGVPTKHNLVKAPRDTGLRTGASRRRQWQIHTLLSNHRQRKVWGSISRMLVPMDPTGLMDRTLHRQGSTQPLGDKLDMVSRQATGQVLQQLLLGHTVVQTPSSSRDTEAGQATGHQDKLRAELSLTIHTADKQYWHLFTITAGINLIARLAIFVEHEACTTERLILIFWDASSGVKRKLVCSQSNLSVKFYVSRFLMVL